jgi:putative transposase
LAQLARGAKVKQRIVGVADQEDEESAVICVQRRRGRAAQVAATLGPNVFVIGPSDVQEIIDTYKLCLRKGPTAIKDALQEYLNTRFAKRHPQLYRDYLNGIVSQPVTTRQFRYYTGLWKNIDPKLEINRRTITRHSTEVGALSANGPDEIYEIDATVNRIFMISKKGVALGQPVLYVVIDRWSRYIVGVYLSLKPPSWDEVKYSLLISFTSRNSRFQRLGIDTNDESWPPGRVPSVLLADRGAEFRGAAIERSVADNLRIEIDNLPARTPDGKAVVERVIKELKRRNAALKTPGTYSDRPTDYETRAIVDKARTAAVYDLQDAYRELINQVEMYNNSTHKTLSKKTNVIRHGVSPTPKSFYLWGRENLTGLSTPPLSDKDYQRMLMGIGEASISSTGMRYRRQDYVPANEEARRILAGKKGRSNKVQIRGDGSDPSVIYMETTSGNWAQWNMTKGSAENTRGLSLDEIDLIQGETGLIVAESRHKSDLDDVKAQANSKIRVKKVTVVGNVPHSKIKRVMTQETNQIKRAMQDRPPKVKPVARPEQHPKTSGWETLQAEERRNAARNMKVKRKR